MSVNEQLAAYRARKAAQKEEETRDNSSFFTKTFSVLRSRSKTTGSGETTTREDAPNPMSLQQHEKSDNDPTPPAAQCTPPHRDARPAHRDLLLPPPAGPRPDVWWGCLLQDGRLLTGRRVLKGLLWLILYGLFIELQFGCVYFIVSLFYFVYTSMEAGTRDKARPSAYSVFNDNCERIDGTFTTEQFEKELRYGAMSVH